MARPTSNLGLILRGNVQWARTVIPRDVRAVIGKSEFLESLGTISECEAAAKAFPIRAAWAEQIARARTGTYCKAIEMEVAGPVKPMPFLSVRGVSAGETSFWALIEAWKNKRNIDNHRTIGRTTTSFTRLAKFLGHDDARRVGPRDMVAFEEMLQKASDPRTKKPYEGNTVIGTLTSMQGVFTVAVQTFRLDVSPMANMHIGTKTASDRQAYSIAQVTKILQAASQNTYDVFLPLLVQAYTGCRIAEIVDATTYDIEQIDGEWCLHIREDYREAGQTIKGGNGKARTVPLHPEIVRHLIPYWQGLAPGPLFPLLPKATKDNRRSTYTARKIGDWIRDTKNGLGITERRLAPNHSFRHYLKSQLVDRDVSDRVLDAITGHTTPGIGRRYEHVEIPKMRAAINLLPVIELEAKT